MLTRTHATSLAGQAGARRRMRRVSRGPSLYCATNGCATTLIVDAASGVARCPICGFTRAAAH